MIDQAEVHWILNGWCTLGCDYCPSRLNNVDNGRNVEEYLTVIRKLQASRYKNAKSIKWKLGGGEPLQFPGLSIVLNEIKKMPSFVRLDTSGGETWFDLMSIINKIDHIKLSQHYWQNSSVLDFTIDLCKDNNVKLDVMIPLLPGKIDECRLKVSELVAQGVNAHEQPLTNDAKGKHDLWDGYSLKDKYKILGLPEDYQPPAPPPRDPNQPDPQWVDPRIIRDPEFVYTGKQCFAGVDFIFIGAKGFASASDCGGRDLGNVFDPAWQAPDASFACPMFQCLSERDRKIIRVNQ